jgi:hypothetical protein
MRSRPFGASATANVPSGATAKAVGSMIRPDSAPIWTISHELACSASMPNTVCARRSKTKNCPEEDC